MRRGLLISFFIVAAVAVGTAIALWKVQSDQARKLDTMNKELVAFSAQKDSLTRNLNEATKFMSDVYVQVSNISGEVAVSRSVENIDNFDYKAQIASKLQTISSMVDGYRNQMQSAELRIAALKRQNIAFAGQIKTLEESVAQMKHVIETQQAQIGKLSDELELTKAERDQYKREALEKARQLVAKNEQLVAKTEQLAVTTEQLNTAYYIVGTVDDLSAKGIIEKKGKVLFLGGAWQPVAGLADSANLVSMFKKVNIQKDMSIPLPFQSYKVISAHNPSYIELKVGELGVSPFALKITKPDKFWAQSKFLIVVEW
jgi:predicted  nucleic acid-binding Zn-ribbon protein